LLKRSAPPFWNAFTQENTSHSKDEETRPTVQPMKPYKEEEAEEEERV